MWHTYSSFRAWNFYLYSEAASNFKVVFLPLDSCALTSFPLPLDLAFSVQRFTLFGRFSGISLIRLERLRSSPLSLSQKLEATDVVLQIKSHRKKKKKQLWCSCCRGDSGNAVAVDTVSSGLDAKEQTTALIASRGGKQNQSKHFHIIIGPKTFLFPPKKNFISELYEKKTWTHLSRWLIPPFKTFRGEVLREIQDKT